jgi:hypothetical protein
MPNNEPNSFVLQAHSQPPATLSLYLSDTVSDPAERKLATTGMGAYVADHHKCLNDRFTALTCRSPIFCD